MAPTVHEVTVNSFTMVPPMIRVGVCAGDEIRVTHAGAASEAHVLCMVEPSARRRCAAIRHGETASFAVSELAAGSGDALDGQDGPLRRIRRKTRQHSVGSLHSSWLLDRPGPLAAGG